MPKKIGERPLTTAERNARHRQRIKDTIAAYEAALDEYADTLWECRAFINPNEGPSAAMARMRADRLLKRTGKWPVPDDSGDAGHDDYDDEEKE